MNVKTKIKLGTDEFEISQDVKDQTEFFEFSAFFSSIPKVGPNGETDLKLVHRTPQGYNYYSIVSEKAKMEYKFGQSKENPGTLFGKGWEPLFQKADGATTSAPTNTTAQSPIGAFGPPIGNVGPSPLQAAPTPIQAPAPIQPQVVPQSAPVVPTTPAASVPAAAVSPAVKTAATDVLARFGINQPASKGV